MAPSYRSGPGFERPPGRLRQPVHELIGRRLKSYYHDVEQQPLPERINELLEMLDGIEAQAGSRRNDS